MDSAFCSLVVIVSEDRNVERLCHKEIFHVRFQELNWKVRACPTLTLTFKVLPIEGGVCELENSFL